VRIDAESLADPAVRDGVVSITHGHPDANPGDLTSGNEAVDELTAMPVVSGLPVLVTGNATERRAGSDRIRRPDDQ
jgi:hypothetical protein